MVFWNNMGLTRKMAVFIGSMLIAIAILSADFLFTIGQLSEDAHAVQDADSHSAFILAREIDHLNWLSGLQKYAFDPEQTALSVQVDPHKCALGQWYYGPARQELTAKYPELDAVLRDLEKPHTALHESAVKIRQLREEGNAAAALQVFDDISVPSLQAVQGAFRKITSIMENHQAAALQSFEDSVSFSKVSAGTIIAFGIVLAVLMGILIARTVTAPIVQLARSVDSIAEGNLDMDLTMTRKDEIGNLAAGMQHMVDNIKAMIVKTGEKAREAEECSAKALEAMRAAEAAQKAAERAKAEGMFAAAEQLENVLSGLSSAADQLSIQVVESERGAEEQAGRVKDTAVAMEEMTASILEVAKTAGAASDFSVATKEKAGEGAAVVQQAVAGIQNVQAVSLTMNSDIAKLAEQASAISNIMGVISDIADQTNLLALNAAIEAARAGEAGRGFAVVADEVRKLAEKTMASTSNVRQSVSGIQESVTVSIAEVEKAVDLIQTVTVEATRAGEVLSEIVTMADSTADQVRAIAAASEEQSATCEDINRAISEINTIANQTASAMHKANTAVSDMTGHVNGVNTLISDMKTG
jgi:methyl-accepting chemotaxis protein